MAKKLTAWQKVKQIFWRMIATFAANGLATIGAGSLIGIEILDAIILAGTLGVVKVSEDLARAFLDDGSCRLHPEEKRSRNLVLVLLHLMSAL